MKQLLRHILRHILHQIKALADSPVALAVWVLAGLMVPNTILCATEPDSIFGCLASFFIPAGLYAIILSLIKRTGISTFVLFPFMFFSAFQLVLLHLYGEGLIAVDMFLNVFTTSFSEATELLSNLVMALVTVIVLYVTALVWGGYAWKKDLRLSARAAKRFLGCGIVWLAIGASSAGAGYLYVPGFNIIRSVFPANVIDNLVEAVNRTRQMANYAESSDRFTYNAVSDADPLLKELYILVIGETGRAHNWQLGGYNRDTNPNLSRRKGLTYFPKSFSESNTTHKSVPMLISAAAAENFDSIYNYKSIITAFNEAGYNTAFFSVQPPNRSYTQFFSDEADNTVYIPGGELSAAHDGKLLPLLKKEIDKNYTKLFIVLHTYGSHFRYSDRYPGKFARFTPDHCVDANIQNRARLINAYDNTILYTDYILSQVIDAADAANCRAAVIYSTDHGEDIFDDSRNRFLHASPTPTAMQIHVPVLCWLSDECLNQSPEYNACLSRNSQLYVSPQKSLCMTLLDIAGIRTPYMRRKWSLVSHEYTEPEPVYLTDRNEPLPWNVINLKDNDWEYIRNILNSEKFNKSATNKTAHEYKVSQSK